MRIDQWIKQWRVYWNVWILAASQATFQTAKYINPDTSWNGCKAFLDSLCSFNLNLGFEKAKRVHSANLLLLRTFYFCRITMSEWNANATEWWLKFNLKRVWAFEHGVGVNTRWRDVWACMEFCWNTVTKLGEEQEEFVVLIGASAI